jgi:TolB-like protein
MLTGKAPFTQVYDAATINAILNESPEPLRRFKADIPEIFQNIVDAALNKSVENRYQKIKDLHADLKLAMQKTSAIEPRKLPHYRTRKLRLFYLVTLAIILVFFFSWLKWSGRFDTTPPEKHLAVLPFASLGDISTTQAFCDGLIETLASQLTQMVQFHGTLYVVPASEVREKKITSVRQARKIFGITHAVTGSVQRRDGEIRMTINLVDAKTERQLRSKIIDEKMEKVSSLQDSIVTELEEMLEIHLKPRDRRILTAGGTASPSAYYSYLQASGYLQRYESAKSIDSAIDLFSDAIERDPNYALAYAGLGKAYWQKYNLSMDVQWVDPP